MLLGQVASITPAQGPSQIQRQDRQRVITLGASLVQGAVLGDVSQQVDRTMKETAAQWPAGYRFTLGGESESQTETFIEFGSALLLSIVLVYMLLVALYESLLYPLIVLLALPLALVGAMGGLALGGQTLNLFSLIGIILLTGLVGKNSILVVDYTNNLRSQGLDRNTALLTAGPARLRPILMTSAALIFAQIPLMLQLEEGSEINAPLGWVVAGGMATSTLLALIFVPAMYTIIDDFQNWILRLFRRGTGGPKKEGDMDGGIRRPDQPVEQEGPPDGGAGRPERPPQEGWRPPRGGHRHHRDQRAAGRWPAAGRLRRRRGGEHGEGRPRPAPAQRGRDRRAAAGPQGHLRLQRHRRGGEPGGRRPQDGGPGVPPGRRGGAAGQGRAAPGRARPRRPGRPGGPGGGRADRGPGQAGPAAAGPAQ